MRLQIIITFTVFIGMIIVVDLGVLNFQVSRTHSGTPQSVRLFWTSDQPDAETSTWQHTTLRRDRLLCPAGIRTRNLSKRTAPDLRLRKRGHWNRQTCFFRNSNFAVYTFSSTLLLMGGKPGIWPYWKKVYWVCLGTGCSGEYSDRCEKSREGGGIPQLQEL